MRRMTILSALTLVLATACDGGSATAHSTIAPTTSGSIAPAPTTTAVVETTSTTEDPARAEAEAAALERAFAFFAAVNARQVDELEEILGVPLSEADRRQWEFHSILKSVGFEWEVESCEISSTFGSIINVECVMHNGNPVFEVTGASEVIAPFTIIGDELRHSQWEPLGAGLDAPLGVMVDYLTLYTDQYRLCDPGEVEGEFTEHLGLARVPECAEAVVEHMDDMVAWAEAGMPAP